MKGRERKAKKNSIYDTMEHDTDSKAERWFRSPAMTQGKLTALAAVKSSNGI